MKCQTWLKPIATLCAAACMVVVSAAQEAVEQDEASYALLVGAVPEQIYDKSLRGQLPGSPSKLKWVKATCKTNLLDAYYNDRTSPKRFNVWLKRLTNHEWSHVLIKAPAMDMEPWLPELAFEGLRLSVDRILEKNPAAQIWLMGPGADSGGEREQLMCSDLRRIAAGLQIGYFSKNGSDYQFEAKPQVDGDYVGYVTPLSLKGDLIGLAFGTSTMARAIKKKLPGLFERDPKRDLELHAVGGSMTENLSDARVREGLHESKADFCWAQDKGEDFVATLDRFRNELDQDAPFLYFLRYHDLTTIENVNRIGAMMAMEGRNAQLFGSKAIPLRAAWGRMWERYPDLPMMESNLKHAADPVMRLIAAMTYAILTGEDPKKIVTGAPGQIASEVIYELGNLRLSADGLAARPLLWYRDSERALEQARAKGMPLLLVAADDKRSAQTTSAALADAACKSQLRKFVLLRINLPSDSTALKELKIKSGANLVVLDPKQENPYAKPVAKLSGKRDVDDVIQFLEKAQKRPRD